MYNDISFALFLTFLAGLSTVLGGAFVFLFKQINARFLSFGLGFSAGVMIYLALFELLEEANNELQLSLGHEAHWQTTGFFVLGLAIAGAIDLITFHQAKICENLNLSISSQKKNSRNCLIYKSNSKQGLLRTGLFVAFAIALHNFPEGMITFTAANVNYVFGLSVALAVAVHNIPEGLCVSLPIFYATKDKMKSLFYTLLAGLSEPVGALVVYFFFSKYLDSVVLGRMLAAVAGIMVYISIDELLPTARRFARWHVSLFGLVSGIAVIASSLYLLNK